MEKDNAWWVVGLVGAIALVLVGVLALVIGSTMRPSEPNPVTSPDQVQRITPAEARRLLDRGTAVLYDARSAELYHIQHAAGAISFPEAEMEERHGELPADKVLIFN